MNSGDKNDLDVNRIREQFERVDTAAPASNQQYREITAEARERSLSLHDDRLNRIEGLESTLRRRLLRWIAFWLLLFGGVGYWIWQYSPDSGPAAPEELPRWLAQQQLLEQVNKVQEWLSEGQAESTAPPPQSFAELQAWLDQIELNPDLQSSNEANSDGGPGFVPFQCSAAPVSCPAEFVPDDEGDYRFELSRLVRNANIMLSDKGDCEGTVDLIREYGSLFGWRRSEAITKARTELSVARCFAQNGDQENAGLHFQRTFCASVSDPDPDQAMSALYGLTRIAHQENDMGLVRDRVDCSESLLDFHLSKETSVATLHHYVSLALMHYEFLDDTEEAIRLQEKALEKLRVLLASADVANRDEHLGLMLTLQLNLMEGYITINDSAPMAEMFDEVNRNPRLGDADRLVALSMLIMQNLTDDNPQQARINLTELIQRYEGLQEFTTLWSWDAFNRWLEGSKEERSETLDQQLRDLRDALSPPKSAQSLATLYQLLSELGAQ